MNIGFLSAYSSLNKGNRLFIDENSDIGDNLLLPFVLLREEADKKGIVLRTVTEENLHDHDAYVLIDIPNHSDRLKTEIINSKKKKYLILLECKYIMPKGYCSEFHEEFDKIFTWDEGLIELDNERYIKINFSHQLPLKAKPNTQKRRKKLVMIAGNKTSNDPFELYSKRKNIIDFYDDKNSLDLYGLGWEVRCFQSRYMKSISHRFPFLKSIGYSHPNSYKGAVKRKSLY